MAKKKHPIRKLIPRPIKRALWWSWWAFHRATGPVRTLPDYIGIGTQKGGTSSLFYQLGQHPCVGRSLIKEVDFFDNNWHKGLGWYRAFFPTVFTRWFHTKVRGQPYVTGEVSPYYMMHPHAARRAASVLPDLKVIAILRNPIDRAFSHWNRYHLSGMESLSFEDAIDQEPQRLAGELEKMEADEHYFSYNYWHFGYLERGIYIKQLPRWFEAFPKEQILVLSSEEYRSDPERILREVEAFLGIPHMERPPKEEYNVGQYPAQMAPETRARLAEFFRPYNQQLYEFLGRDFGWDR